MSKLYEIKQINDTDSVVVNDERIDGDLISYFNTTTGTLHKLHSRMIGSNNLYTGINGGICHGAFECKKVIATISPFKIEGLPMLELPNQEEDVEKLALGAFKAAMQFCHTDFSDTAYNRFRTWFSQNYKAAQKQYSEEIYDTAIQIVGDNKVQSIREFLQSLQKNQFPISVELTEDLQVIKWYYE